MDKYKYKLKGVGPITRHLGCDFGRDIDGTLYYGPMEYVKKMIGAYEKMLATNLVSAPHPWKMEIIRNLMILKN